MRYGPLGNREDQCPDIYKKEPKTPDSNIASFGSEGIAYEEEKSSQDNFSKLSDSYKKKKAAEYSDDDNEKIF